MRAMPRPRAAGDDIRNAIVIGVAGCLDASAEFVATGAVRAPQQPAARSGVDIDTARVGVPLPVGRGRGHDVIDPVPVDIADVARDPAELIVGGLAAPLANDPDRFNERRFELPLLRQQRAHTRISLQCLQIRVDVDLRHIVAVRRARAFQPLQCSRRVVCRGVGGTEGVEDLR